jgi:hypothetical protein
VPHGAAKSTGTARFVVSFTLFFVFLIYFIMYETLREISFLKIENGNECMSKNIIIIRENEKGRKCIKKLFLTVYMEIYGFLNNIYFHI